MHCRAVNVGGNAAIICSRGGRSQLCSSCGNASTQLCDAPTGPGRTCDRRLCLSCTTRGDGDRDYCREHARLGQPQLPLAGAEGERA